MPVLFDSGDRPVRALLHPSDRSRASVTAFHHAVALAVRYGAELTLLNSIGRRSTDSWPDFPSVRDTVARWRAAGLERETERRGRRARVRKLGVREGDPVAASLDYVHRNSVDMIVVATEGRGGLARLIRAPRAEKLARESGLPTLFIPNGGRPFVRQDTGEIMLRRILLPIDTATDPRPAMLHAVRAARMLSDPSLEITLLHVGEGEERDVAEVPQLPFCRWAVKRRGGEVVTQILDVADEIDAGAIYMSTSWPRAAPGRFERSVTERVIRGAGCPVAAVPADPS